MRTRSLVSVSILAAALAVTASDALAAGADAAHRADMKSVVLRARAAGELRPAGEAIEPLAVPTGGTMLSRSRVREDTMVARALGQLVPAGEGMAPAVPTGSTMARADVRDSVRQARLNGELVPAGEGMGPMEMQARARMSRAQMLALKTRR